MLIGLARGAIVEQSRIPLTNTLTRAALLREADRRNGVTPNVGTSYEMVPVGVSRARLFLPAELEMRLTLALHTPRACCAGWVPDPALGRTEGLPAEAVRQETAVGPVARSGDLATARPRSATQS